MNDALGDRMKIYEGQESERRFLPLLPVMARLDGRSFSRFTKGLARPFDKRLSDLMVDTALHLLNTTTAVCGYTQSDEITMAWYAGTPKSQIFFDGRIQKMVSSLAASASVEFNRLLGERIPEKQGFYPTFDCRVWQVPTLTEAVNTFLWRELDATKNSISMAAFEHYSHKELMGKSGDEKQEMLWQKGINWNDYPDSFKRGTYVQRRVTWGTISDLGDLPPQHHARSNPGMLYRRCKPMRLALPPLAKVSNPVEVIFEGKEPV